MKALTLWRPWPVAIFFLRPDIRKDVENRSWKLPKRVVGQRIAIHAGSRLDNGAFEQWLKIIRPEHTGAFQLLAHWKKLSEVQGIIGTAIFGESIPEEKCSSPWASGPECWPIIDPIALPKPIPCKGAQGLWNVPPEIERQINESH